MESIHKQIFMWLVEATWSLAVQPVSKITSLIKIESVPEIKLGMVMVSSRNYIIHSNVFCLSSSINHATKSRKVGGSIPYGVI